MKSTLIVFHSILFIFIVACSSSENGSEVEEQVEQEIVDEEPVPEDVEKVETGEVQYALLTTQRVKDYDIWIKHFEAYDEQRRAFGIEVINVFQEDENENNVVVMLGIEDLGKARDYLFSGDLFAKMEAAGVESTPKMKLLSTSFDFTEGGDERLKCMFITQEVEDFDTWHEVYKADDANRAANGMVTMNIFRSPDKENEVTVMLAVNDFKQVAAFAGSKDFQATMKKAGVIGEPTLIMLMASI